MNIEWNCGAFRVGDFKLYDRGLVAPILFDEADFEVVRIVARHFAADVERVTGHIPDTAISPYHLSGHVVIAGTLGHSRWIDALVEDGKVVTADLIHLPESFVLQVVDNPFPDINTALVIAGSDRRGTAYGIFEVSKQIGVSPWYWWADVPTTRRECVIVRAGRQLTGPPAVRYRGIFINDEDWSLREWASITFAPEEAQGQKGFGPRTYEKIFELLLRLRANLLWPAMHPGTKPFNDYPENKILADRYAIIMGSSHCEQMLRNNVGEWDTARDGDWNFVTNRERMIDYWAERVRENGRCENIYTLGLRGIHDDPMPGHESLEKRAARLTDVIEAQRNILREHVSANVQAVPQILCVYKEVLELYKAGMHLPPDVTIVFSDDNYGYITCLPSSQERAQYSKFGIYYHISYWGRPHDYLWLYSTPLALIWSEMRKAFDRGAADLWVVNVGGLKAHEIGMEYFLGMAWNANSWEADSPKRFLTEWAKREFGLSQPQEMADLLTEYFTLTFARKPEHMGWNKVYPETQNRLSEFSPTCYGDEAERYLERYAALVKQVNAIYDQLEAAKRDAFYQLVVYPVRCAALTAQKFLYAQKSQFYAAQGRSSAAFYAALARQAFEAIQSETDYYNTQTAGGKWQHVISCRPRNLPVFAMPPTVDTPHPLKTAVGIVVEGAELPGSMAGEQGANHWLPSFNRFTQERHFFDIFNSGSAPVQWKAVPSAAWIHLSATEGLLELEQRIWINIDWESVPPGDNITGEIVVSGAGSSETLKFHVFNPAWPEVTGTQMIVESNGAVSVHGAHFTRCSSDERAVVQVIPGLGRSGEAVSILSAGEDDAEADFCVELEYRMVLFTPGSHLVHCYCLPMHPLYPGRGQRFTVLFNEEAGQTVDITANGGENDKVWQDNVLRGAAIASTRHRITAPGWHTLKIRILDPGLVIDQIVIDTGGLMPSYLGPPETISRKSQPAGMISGSSLVC